MKRIVIGFEFVLLIAFLMRGAVRAETTETLIQEGDAVYEKLTYEGFRDAIPFYEKAIALESDSFEANWKCARAYARYAATLKWEQYKLKQKGDPLKNWEKKSAELGDKGMVYATKAQELAPKSVEGYYWFVRCVLARAEGVSWLTALGEGFYPRVKKAICTAYEIDKTYYDYSPVFMIANFYSQIPWPMRDDKKALHYYEEFRKLSPNVVEKEERECFAAELLLRQKGEEYREQAKALLDFVSQSEEPFLRDWAKGLLKKHF